MIRDLNTLEQSKPLVFLFGFIFLSALMHADKFNLDVRGIHSWRQSQTMWNVRNFVRHDANILNPRVSHFNGGKDNINRYEFPIMQWSIAMLQRVFGEHVLIFRLSMFLIAAWGAIGFFRLLQLLLSHNLAALIGTVMLIFSPIFYLYCINPIPDVLALSAGFWYLFYVFKYFKSRSNQDVILAAFALLLATLSKLPFLMFSIVSILYFFRSIVNEKQLSKQLIYFSGLQVILILPALFWYKWVMPSWEGNGILAGIFDNRLPLNEILGIASYHVKTMFPFILTSPAHWLFLMLGFWLIRENKEYSIYIVALIMISFLYLALQFNMIGKVHDYYMFPFLP